MAENSDTPKLSADYWDSDKLNRKKDADYLLRFLTGYATKRKKQYKEPKSLVLNLDSKWGGGKTYFLLGFKYSLQNSRYPVAYINAWENDHAKDPLIPIIATIEDTLKEHLSKNQKIRKAWETAKTSGLKIARIAVVSAAKVGIRKVIGEGIEEISDLDITSSGETAGEENNETLLKDVETLLNKHAQNLLDEYYQEKQATINFKENLTLLLNQLNHLKSINLPMFVLIDELDRCRPTYAIELLERVKHLFEVNNIVFILATDTSQLQHSIKSVYGQGFDAHQYLHRFFDRTYTFQKPTISEFVDHQLTTLEIDLSKLIAPFNDDAKKFLCITFKAFDLTLRDISQCLEILDIFETTWPYDHNIQLTVLLPVILAFRKGAHSEEFIQFTNNTFPQSFLNVPAWTGSHYFYLNDRYSRSERVVQYASLAGSIWSRAKASFHEMQDYENSESPENRFVRDIFHEESQKRWGGIIQRNTFSHILQYPELIAAGGQLLSEINDEDQLPHE
ncbi:hypothetical protein GQF03_11470 [Sneathiella chungangensis]|uniref:KAP NTPase domain-containing protein n=1 Tax=Sneathiella chungangensis TaxID=1418234 RepID=A0A845MFZ4_9PROT|nr:P-loop NTPase fold protein [Sneathiella chungangensis]MZR22953.1 hypothetical protein [Sneathiella chungangensis]